MHLECGDCGELIKVPDENVRNFEFFEKHIHQPGKALCICPCGETLPMGPLVWPDARIGALQFAAFYFKHRRHTEADRWQN
jgi:hypothetical protein